MNTVSKYPCVATIDYTKFKSFLIDLFGDDLETIYTLPINSYDYNLVNEFIVNSIEFHTESSIIFLKDKIKINTSGILLGDIPDNKIYDHTMAVYDINMINEDPCRYILGFAIEAFSRDYTSMYTTYSKDDVSLYLKVGSSATESVIDYQAFSYISDGVMSDVA